MFAATVGVWLAVSALPALAVTHPFITQLRGFSFARSVAEDAVSGDLLVADSGTGVVYVYDSSFNRIATWTGSNTPSGSFGGSTVSVAASNATGNVYVGGRGVVDILSSTGAFLGQLTGAPPMSPTAVSVDQATGDIYVVSSERAVYVFDSAGVYQSTLAMPSGYQYGITVTGVAVNDLSGQVLVAANTIVSAQSQNLVFVYDAASGSYQTTWNGSATTNPPGTPSGSFGGTRVGSVAADSASGHVYVGNPDDAAVDELDASGGYLSQITGTPFGSFSYPDVDVGSVTGDVYVEDTGQGVVDVFGPPPSPSKPNVDSESAVDVASDSAGLSAQVNPDQLDTTYHFEYGPTTSYGTDVPVPDADLGSGTNDLTASAQVSGLQPATTYHYRVVATNSLGSTDGPDHAFTTPSPSGSFALPDNRAYEMVSPPDKGDGEVNNRNGQVFNDAAAPDGGAITYYAQTAFPGSASGLGGQYLAVRGPNGWSSQNLIPASDTISNKQCSVGYDLFSPDLSRGVLHDGPGAATCQDDPLLVANEPPNQTNLFLRNTADGSYELLTAAPLTPGGAVADSSVIAGASPDLRHVVFWSNAQFLPQANSGTPNLYESADGSLSLVSVLPNGSATSAAAVGDGGAPGGLNTHYTGSVSDDGSKVFWTATSTGDLYLRENGTNTVQVDASQGPGAGGGGRFMAATPDGSEAFFTDGASAGLTNDTVSGSGQNLYSYDVATGKLSDLTPASAAGVLGVVALSQDGSYLYFVADGALASGATAGQPNLYLLHGGTTTFIATLSSSDATDWAATPSRGARVTPDGTHLAFDSVLSLTGNDNRDVNSGNPDNEIYLYDAGSGELRCASCNPSGAAPTGPANFNSQYPGDTNEWDSFYAPRNLSDNGDRLFFDSADALVPGDTNSQRDVYEWERDGSGTCTQASGCVYLISSGTGSSYSAFVDADTSGDNVFFLTSQALLPQDTDTSLDIYDARVCTSSDPCITPPPGPPGPCTSSDVCQGGSSPAPAPVVAGSVSFNGPGNLTPGGSTPRVRLLTRVVHGTSFFLRVRVPARARIAIAGRGIRRVSRFVGRAGVYRLRVSLTRKMRRLLLRKHHLRLTLRVSYAPPSGRAQTANVRLTVKPALRHGHNRARRASRTQRTQGGIR